jgi:hypothetical protein
MQVKSFLNKMTVVPTTMRAMSSATISDRFESAYKERVANLANSPKKM